MFKKSGVVFSTFVNAISIEGSQFTSSFDRSWRHVRIEVGSHEEVELNIRA